MIAPEKDGGVYGLVGKCCCKQQGAGNSGVLLGGRWVRLPKLKETLDTAESVPIFKAFHGGSVGRTKPTSVDLSSKRGHPTDVLTSYRPLAGEMGTRGMRLVLGGLLDEQRPKDQRYYAHELD